MFAVLGDGAWAPEVAEQLEGAEWTCHRWGNEYGRMEADDARRPTTLGVRASG